MLIRDLREIGNNMLRLRKEQGLTQGELAEKAGVADRTYADIERGTVNMRLMTLIRICEALNVLPNDLLVNNDFDIEMEHMDIVNRLSLCATSNRETAIKLLQVYLNSIT